jgi:hypothetical protein
VRKVALTISHFVNVPQLIAKTDLVAAIARPIPQTASQFFPITLPGTVPYCLHADKASLASTIRQ